MPRRSTATSRAELVGERTLGRAARQQLVKLPDGSGLLLSSMRYLTPANAGIHETRPDARRPGRQPDVEFGAQPAGKDETLDTALARLAEEEGSLDVYLVILKVRVFACFCDGQARSSVG